MKAELRRRLQDPARIERVRAFLDELPEPATGLEETLFEAQLPESSVDGTSVAPMSLLLIHLQGPHIPSGSLDPRVQEKVVTPLLKEFSKASDGATLGLVGVGSGSLVLRFRPTSLPKPDEGGLAYVVSVADTAVEDVFDLHSLLEDTHPAQEIQARYGENVSLLKAASKLAEGLRDLSADLTAYWWGSNAKRHSSRFTQAGQAYALELFEAMRVEEPEDIQGIVSALDLDGVVTVRTSSKNKRTIQVEAQIIADGLFELGKLTHLRAQRVRDVDKVGVAHSHSSYEFIEFIEHSPDDLELPID